MRARREVHNSHEHFFSDFGSKPQKELKKVLTPKVLELDRWAVRAVASRIQKEETFKMAWKQMEQERRDDIRGRFAERQYHNDMLMHMSGQRSEQSGRQASKNSCTTRTLGLAKPRDAAAPPEVTKLTDFRGLF